MTADTPQPRVCCVCSKPLPPGRREWCSDACVAQDVAETVSLLDVLAAIALEAMGNVETAEPTAA